MDLVKGGEAGRKGESEQSHRRVFEVAVGGTSSQNIRQNGKWGARLRTEWMRVARFGENKGNEEGPQEGAFHG